MFIRGKSLLISNYGKCALQSSTGKQLCGNKTSDHHHQSLLPHSWWTFPWSWFYRVHRHGDIFNVNFRVILARKPSVLGITTPEGPPLSELSYCFVFKNKVKNPVWKHGLNQVWTHHSQQRTSSLLWRNDLWGWLIWNLQKCLHEPLQVHLILFLSPLGPSASHIKPLRFLYPSSLFTQSAECLHFKH